jgi:hypothetical protein
MLKTEYILSICLIVFLISCGDLQKPSSTSKCDDALNAQNWDIAISNCSSSRSKGDAYMGKAGFTIMNLMDRSSGETKPSHVSTAESNNSLGSLDSTGAKIFYILGFGYSQINDDADRKSAMDSKKTNLDNAIDSYKGVITSDKDAALMYTYANVFAMQIDISQKYDKETGKASSGLISGISCPNTVSGNSGNKMHDGYLFKYEENQSNCAKNLTQMCTNLQDTIKYIANITNGLKHSGIGDTSGNNTSFIDSSKEATCAMVKVITDAGGTCDSEC